MGHPGELLPAMLGVWLGGLCPFEEGFDYAVPCEELVVSALLLNSEDNLRNRESKLTGGLVVLGGGLERVDLW